MTREDRWIVTLDEIAGLRWQCPRCTVAVTYALTELVVLPRACPACNADVIPDDASADGQAVRAFVHSLKALRAASARIPVSLEFIAKPGR